MKVKCKIVGERATWATASSEGKINFFGNGNGGKKVAKLSQEL